MQAVAQQDQIGEGLPAVGARSVAMVPMEELLEGQEVTEAGQDPEIGGDAASVPMGRFGDHVE